MSSTVFKDQVTILKNVLYSSEYENWQCKYFEDIANDFEDSDENKLIYTEHHNKYVEHVEKTLMQPIVDKYPDFDMLKFCEDFIAASNQGELQDANLYDVLTRLDDFQAFRDTVLKWKVHFSNQGTVGSNQCLSKTKFEEVNKIIQDYTDYKLIYNSDVRKMYACNSDPTLFKLRVDLSHVPWKNIYGYCSNIDSQRQLFNNSGMGTFQEIGKGDTYFDGLMSVKMMFMNKREMLIRIESSVIDDSTIMWDAYSIENEHYPITSAAIRTAFKRQVIVKKIKDGEHILCGLIYNEMGQYVPTIVMNYFLGYLLNSMIQKNLISGIENYKA